jgi:CelD/BcsL family acetyltransferase involved in cellulose biosynthesis
MSSLRLHVVADEPALAELREEWAALLEASGTSTPFLSWEWLYTWWRHFGGGGQPHVVAVRAGGALVALAPWFVEPQALAALRLMPTLRWLGAGDVGSDYLDVVLRPGFVPEALAEVTDHLAQQSLALDLAGLPMGSHARELAGGLAQRGWTVSRRSSATCPFIRLAGRSWDEYLGMLGSEHRYNFKRRLRRLQQDHGMRFERVATESDRRAALDALVKLHNSRWAVRGGSTAFHSPQLVAFHHDVSALALSRGWLRLYVLWVDDAPAAALYGFAYGGRFHFYQAGFDVGLSRLSVGLVTMGLAIREAFAEGLGEYDFLHGDEPYKFLWARETRDIERLELYPPQLRGAVCHATAQTCRRARQLARRLVDAGRRARGPREDIRARPSTVVPTTR